MALQEAVVDLRNRNQQLFTSNNIFCSHKKRYMIPILFNNLVLDFEKLSDREEYRTPSIIANCFEKLQKQYEFPQLDMIPSKAFCQLFFISMNNLSEEITHVLEDKLIGEKELENIGNLNKLLFAYNVIRYMGIEGMAEIENIENTEEVNEITANYVKCLFLIVIRLHEIYTDIVRNKKPNCFEHLEEEIGIVEQYLNLRYPKDENIDTFMRFLTQ